MNIAAVAFPTVTALPMGGGGLVLDVRAATTPQLLQQGGNWIADLLPVIIFMVISVVPSLVQARKKAKERQQGGAQPPRDQGQGSSPKKAPDLDVQPPLRGPTESQDRASSPRSKSPPAGTRPAGTQPAGNDLEARVKRYFEELVGPPQTPAPTPPPPPRTPPRPRPPAQAAPPRASAPRSRSLVDAHVELGDAHVELGDSHVELTGLDRKKLPSRAAPERDIPQRARSQSGASKGRSRRVHPLLQGRSLRDAIVLREVFGPPKGLN